MRVGVHINRFNHPGGPAAVGPELAATGAAAEAAGVSWLSVMDHYFQMEFNGGAEDAMLEAYTTLGFLAGNTSTVQLGALVTGVTYRNPGLLAKIATTLDVLSGGRATLGIGAAWYDREHHGLGVHYPPVAERFERLKETLRICLQMWDPETNGPFEGRHYQLAETLCVPAPISSPHPEIMIGGGGEKKTLRLVAQYADACNLIVSTPDELRHKLDVLRGHCDNLGRDYDRIRKTIVHTGESVTTGDLDAFLREIDGFTKFGVDTVILGPRTGEPVEWIERFVAPAVPRLAELD
ncbi:LLM class F420-dependent oxidoreductase [Streptomyces sp. NBC_00988]|uniref:LLM class F420-dependent oxidoreductase n=1 Tax=Streptomyces sp. NBC_00988 TaxID=2903704 RepID=UPI003867B8A5|nr:LLM class F420-dependent oxidoreductase [Streptomyces sp. NBC_00988]